MQVCVPRRHRRGRIAGRRLREFFKGRVRRQSGRHDCGRPAQIAMRVMTPAGYPILHSGTVMPRSTKPQRKLPHGFILDALAPLNPEVRRMFSGYGVYVENRIVLILRDHPRSPQDNGVWLVLSESADPADPQLRREFPSLRRIELLGNKIGHWLLIPSDSPGFETEATHACDLLLRHDPRLGRIPASRR